VTSIITAERGDGSLTRKGLEEYVSDCVILLDHRVTEQISTRRLRVVKYRGSTHETNEFPFMIDREGIIVLPITAAGLSHSASSERVSTGVVELDEMLSGQGFFRGSSNLISGTAGTGKTSIAAHFVDAACQRGEHALFFAFEESPSQFMRNMRSIGLNLERWVDAGLLHFHSVRPTYYGLEMHLAQMYRRADEFQPQIVVVDPVTNFIATGTGADVKSMLVRLIDFFKMRGMTSLFTSLTVDRDKVEQTEVGISSLIDTWLLLRDDEKDGERQGSLAVLKSRGMPHSKKVRDFRLTDRGIEMHPKTEAPK
jgi:circadian clock protein KaiC